MTGWNRKLGMVVALTALALPAAAQDAGALFREGVELMERGRQDEALVAFKKALSAEPSNQEAFELFRSVDGDVWLKMLTAEGEMQLVAKRFMTLSDLGRRERSNDADAIRGLLGKVLSDDVVERRTGLRQLAAEHGEFAVPYLLRALADQGNEDRRVLAMDALTRMSGDAVLPLVEALNSDDAFLRRNVALVLGYAGDARALPALSHLANSDGDAGVQAAAGESLTRLGGAVDAAGAYLQAGDDYHFRRSNVMAPHMVSDVVWSWADGSLVSTPIPAALYNDELSRRAYQRALGADSSSTAAKAGLARANVSAMADLDRLEAAEMDTGDWADVVRGRKLEVYLSGADALDAALEASVRENDLVVGAALARMLGEVAVQPTPGLAAAVSSSQGELQAEAALAHAHLALASGQPVADVAISVLALNAGREIVRIAAIVDGDGARAGELAAALEGAGMSVHQWGRGTDALSLARRVPGLDVVIVADSLPDLTTSQVISELRSHPKYADTPMVVIASDADAAGEIFGDSASAIVSGAGELDTILELVADPSGDRARAQDLAARSAQALAHAASSSSIAGAEAALVRNALERGDDVAVPSMAALGLGGGSSAVGALARVALDDDRSDEARSAAAHALAGLFGRGQRPAEDALAALESLLGSDASMEVRSAVAHALGALGRGGDLLAGMSATPSE